MSGRGSAEDDTSLSGTPAASNGTPISDARPFNTAVVVDGNQIAEITPTDEVEISPSPIEFQMLNVPGFSYYLRLQKKLGWGGHLG